MEIERRAEGSASSFFSISSKSPLSLPCAAAITRPRPQPPTGSSGGDSSHGEVLNSGRHVAQIELVTVQECRRCTAVKLPSASICSKTIGECEQTSECAESPSSWDKEKRSGNENNGVYEAARRYGCHFMENIPICELLPCSSYCGRHRWEKQASHFFPLSYSLVM